MQAEISLKEHKFLAIKHWNNFIILALKNNKTKNSS